jgi:hypothetical protein
VFRNGIGIVLGKLRRLRNQRKVSDFNLFCPMLTFLGWKVLHENCDKNTTFITGGPLKNLGRAISKAKELKVNFEIGSWYAQGMPNERIVECSICSIYLFGCFFFLFLCLIFCVFDMNEALRVTISLIGGFAGKGVVPEHLQMEKFRGTCLIDLVTIVVLFWQFGLTARKSNLSYLQFCR